MNVLKLKINTNIFSDLRSCVVKNNINNPYVNKNIIVVRGTKSDKYKRIINN